MYNEHLDVYDPASVAVAIEEAGTDRQAMSCAYRGIAYLLSDLLDEVKALNANLMTNDA